MSDQSNEILIPSEYARLFDSDWREAAVYGGRNSLKSHTVARVLIVRGMNDPLLIACFREFQNSITDSVYGLIVSLIEQYKLVGWKITDSSIRYKNGTSFIFKGLRNNIQSVKSTEGIDIAWVEEAQTISEKSIEVLTPTVRKEGSQLIYTYNRLKPDDPIHKRLVIEGRPNTLTLNLNYDVALKYGWMAQAMIDEMEDDKAKRPEIYKHKWLGEPSTMQGLIYDFERIDTLPEEAEWLGTGLDFGYTNDPTAVIDVYKWNNGYILDERLYQRGMKNKEIAQLLKDSPLVIADSAEPKSIDEIKDEGVTILPAVKGKDSVNNGIQLLQGLTIRYTARSHNIEEELLNYYWKVDKEDKSLNIPIDAYNHAADAFRYFIAHKETVKPVKRSYNPF